MAKLQPYHKLEKLRGNQYAIRVRKTTDPILKKDCVDYALTTLRPSAFKLWVWFRFHEDGDEFGLSCNQICKELNIGNTTYHKVVKELKEKGFLVPALLYSGIKGWLFIDEGPLREIRNVSYKGELSPKGFTIV